MPVSRDCLQCGKSFETFPAWIRKGQAKYCSRDCGFAARKQRAKGRTLAKFRCLFCGKEYQGIPYPRTINRAKYCSPKCTGLSQRRRKTVSCATCGTAITRRIGNLKRSQFHYCSNECRYQSMRVGGQDRSRFRPRGWTRIARAIRERDNYCCTKCGAVGGSELNVHHIVPIRLSQDSSPSNLRTVCKSCHKILDHQFIWLL